MAAPLLITLLCLALVLNLLGFMTVAAVLPHLISDWSLTGTEAGWLGGIYFAGYVAAVPVLASLTDRIDARRIYLLSALLGACACFAFALVADGIAGAIVFRCLTGAGLAGVYMPGLKALTDALPKQTESRAVTQPQCLPWGRPHRSWPAVRSPHCSAGDGRSVSPGWAVWSAPVSPRWCCAVARPLKPARRWG
jgi:hypothetical protein